MNTTYNVLNEECFPIVGDVNAEVDPNVISDSNPLDISKRKIDLPIDSIPKFEENDSILDEEDVETKHGEKMPHAEGLVSYYHR